MKQIFPLLLLTALSQNVSAQQLPNSNFEGKWVSCYPWESGSYASTERGTQPEGWNISNVSNTAMPIVGSQETGADGTGSAVKLSNVSVMGQNAPGYITLGTCWATAETKMTTVRNADGGVFGGIPFAYHPEARLGVFGVGESAAVDTARPGGCRGGRRGAAHVRHRPRVQRMEVPHSR